MSTADELKAQGNKAFSAGQFDEAVSLFTKAIEVDPTNHVFYSNRSASYASLRKYNEALEDANKVISMKPDWPKGYSRKGAALLGQSKYEDAIKTFNEGLTHDESNALLKKGLDEAEAALARSKDMDGGFGKLFSGDVLGKIAKDPKLSPYLAQRDFVEKVQQIQANPSSMQQHLQDPRIMTLMMSLMGLDTEMMSKGSDAEGNASSSSPSSSSEDTPMPDASSPSSKSEAKSEPKDEPMEEKEETEEDKKKKEALAEKDLGNAAYKKREFDTALQHYAKAWKLDPTNISILTNKAAVHFEMEQFQECIQVCEEAVDVGRENLSDYKLIGRALCRIGNAYVKLDNLDEAIKYYNKSLSEHRTADTLGRLKEVEKLKTQREKAAYHNPQLANEARERGNALFKAADWVAASKEYSEAIRRDESDPRAYSNRAACYTKLMAFPEALKDCEKCISLDPTFIKGYIRKAAIEFLKRDHSTCLETCNTALEQDKEGKHRREIEAQMAKCYSAMSGLDSGSSDPNETEEERQKRAASDPEVQKILSDPVMQQILGQMQEDPKAAQEHLKNPMINAKIKKLISAGIIRVGRQ
ncbi:MAG: heat shock protein STI-like protein [Piptocephalis tieghemiana]|nr:MAG: heat shock protein STI-like protein [Piptocephalis tieghemiana]